MADIIGAPTLSDALAALRVWAADKEGTGKRNLIFCEDRLTLLAERAVLDALGGTFLTEVTTFARFLAGSASVLSKQGSVMAISAIISDSAELTCFRADSAQVVYETIAQLSASRVTPEMLREAAAETDGMLRRKLSDLSSVQEAYERFLREKGMVDENGYLALLPETIERELRGANVCFFAFPSFTRQAQEGIRAALLAAESVTGIFPAGKGGLYTNEAAHIFRRLCEEQGEARAVMRRTQLTGDALAVLRGMFTPEVFSAPPERAAGVRVFAAADDAEEYATVASLIRKHVAEGARFRDFAVLVPDAEKFEAVGRVFSSYHIAFFADRRRPFSEHPFCRFLLDVFSAVSDGVLPAEADAIASSVYFGHGDAYRNYLLRFGGYRGAVRREIKQGEAIRGFDGEQLASCRARMLSLLALVPRKGTGRAYTAAVRALAELTEAERVTQELAAQVSPAEGEFLSLDPLAGVLAEIDAVAGGRTFSAREMGDMLQSGFSACTVSLIPQSADAVFVGDATESRFDRVKYLFVTGLTDALPRASADTAVISDRDISRLSSLRVEIEPAIAQVNARSREGLALNLCNFTEAAYFSYPRTQGGKETAKSEVIAYLSAMFLMPPMPELFPYDCCEMQPALLRLSALRAAYERGMSADLKGFSSLYTALLRTDAAAHVRRTAAHGKGKVSCGERLYFSGGTSSPSLLETYFTCPYQGFAKYGLRLREREERSLLNTDAGTFLHAVLERVARGLNEYRDEADCRAAARAAAEELIAAPRFSALPDTKAGEYTAARLIDEAVTVSAAMYGQLIRSSFRVRALEHPVSIPELGLRGTTDRVDESGDFVRVIDYKTGTIDESPTSYYMGRKLQLQLYLKGVSGGQRPAGAFYFPASDPFTAPGEQKFRMLGFYVGENEVTSRLETALAPGQESTLFKGKGGDFSGHGMSEDDFRDFLGYAILVSSRAEREMREGNISPSPASDGCTYCKLRGLCGYDGPVRSARKTGIEEIVAVVRREMQGGRT